MTTLALATTASILSSYDVYTIPDWAVVVSAALLSMAVVVLGIFGLVALRWPAKLHWQVMLGLDLVALTSSIGAVVVGYLFFPSHLVQISQRSADRGRPELHLRREESGVVVSAVLGRHGDFCRDDCGCSARGCDADVLCARRGQVHGGRWGGDGGERFAGGWRLASAGSSRRCRVCHTEPFGVLTWEWMAVLRFRVVQD